MSLSHIVKNAMLGVACFVAFTGGMNYLGHHNVIKQGKGYETHKKIDGLWSWTELHKYYDKNELMSTKIQRFSGGLISVGVVSYTDRDGDRKVDEVYINDDLYNRKDEFSYYPAIFETANDEFQEQLKRFEQ